MSYRGWNSKKDVIKDLARATGKKVKNFDVNYAIIGEQPPPIRHRPDEEMDTQLLRLYGGHEAVCMQERSENIGKPDLEGITKMLRMVDNYNNKPVKEQAPTKHTQTINKENAILLISKLNPDIDEFVPKNHYTLNEVSKQNVNDVLSKDFNSVQCKRSDDEPINEKIGDEFKNINSFEDFTGTNKTDNCDLVNILDNPINISDLSPDEVKDMRTKLKTHINGTSNVKCLKIKRERNLAIATLVKLYCQSPKTEEVKPTLIAPDYYEKGLPNNDKFTTIDGKEADICANDSKFSSDIQLLNKEHYKNNNMVQSHDSNLNTFPKSETFTNERDMAESVDKVQKWLLSSENSQISSESLTEMPIDQLVRKNCESNESLNNNGANKKKTTGPTVYLGPVTFKRKVNSKPMSPTSSCFEEKNKIKKTANFVPTQYASDLAKTYMERDRLKKAFENNIWTNLEAVLKAKDDEIKKRQLLASAAANDLEETVILKTAGDDSSNDTIVDIKKK